jgi:hypothetical protein
MALSNDYGAVRMTETQLPHGRFGLPRRELANAKRIGRE